MTYICNSMTIAQAEQKYQVFISIVPELYKDGVNWNWQILWYNDKKQTEGTFFFGDNHEHPTRENAEKAAIDYLVILKETGNSEALSNYRKTYYDEQDTV